MVEKQSSDESLAADFDYNEDSAPEEVPSDLLAQITHHCGNVLRLAVEAKRLIKELKQVQAQFTHLTEGVLPELMKQAGMTSFNVRGTPVAIKEVVTASCPAPGNQDPEEQKRRVRILRWLDEKGYGKLVTREFKVFFEKSPASQAKADELQKFLREKKAGFTNNSTIHPQTMNAFAKRCLEEGIELPEDFHLHQHEVASLPKEYKIKWNDLNSNTASED